MSGWVTPTQPNISDYTLFLQGIGMNTTVLPTNSPYIGYAFNQASTIVNPYGQCVTVPTGVTNVSYTLAVYNCAAHIQIKITPDQTGQNFFQTLRGPGPGGYNLVGFLPGVVTASSDEGTSQTLVVSEAFKNLTLRDLGYMATPYGRSYLEYAQDYGEIVGLS